ncbi:MAG: YihY family inner membrane protein [Pseudomonadota bacterium]
MNSPFFERIKSVPGYRQASEFVNFTRYALSRFYHDECLQAAASLTYTVLLALVPLTALVIAIYSAFPAFADLQETAQELIFDNFVPQVGEVVSENLQSLAGNAGGLTAVGTIGLVVTSILMLATIESSFNAIWRARESRSWLIRLLTFWAVLTLTPLLFGASLSLGTRLLNETRGVGGGPFIDTVAVVLPVLLQIAGFALLYWIIPNRSVRWRDAAIGGLVAGILFEVAKRGFAFYLTSFPVYQTLYGALAAIPIFLVWLYLVWSITLMGAVVSASLPDWRSGKAIGSRLDAMLPGPRLTLAAGILRVLSDAGRMGVSVTRSYILAQIPIGPAAVDAMLDILRQGRFVERTTDDRWVMTRQPAVTTLHDLLRALGIGMRGPVGRIGAVQGAWQQHLIERIDAAERDSAEALSITLADLFAVPDDDDDKTVTALPNRETG